VSGLVSFGSVENGRIFANPPFDAAARSPCFVFLICSLPISNSQLIFHPPPPPHPFFFSFQVFDRVLARLDTRETSEDHIPAGVSEAGLFLFFIVFKVGPSTVLAPTMASTRSFLSASSVHLCWFVSFPPPLSFPCHSWRNLLFFFFGAVFDTLPLDRVRRL